MRPTALVPKPGPWVPSRLGLCSHLSVKPSLSPATSHQRKLPVSLPGLWLPAPVPQPLPAQLTPEVSSPAQAP